MTALRVALCNDFPEEQWPSMDRVARELVTEIARSHSDVIDISPVCPPFARRASSFCPDRRAAAFTFDRAVNRWWDYPRRLTSMAASYDLFHVIDHSYAHLIHRLPPSRTVVTCHDLDTFRSVLQPRDERRGALFRMGTRRILQGLQSAAHVTCDTGAVRDELLGFDVLPPERVTVVPVGVGDGFTPDADPPADAAAARLVQSPSGAVEILHVGSTIPRKRIDVLLRACAALAGAIPALHLVRVGGPFTREQRRLVADLGLAARISVVDFVSERTLAALYRRAALVLQPSEREGFGLPVLEAMACGTPVVASDLPVLREVGGAAVEYRPVGDVHAWAGAVRALVDERGLRPQQWLARQHAGRVRARCFTWRQFAARMADIYLTLGERNDQTARLCTTT